MKSKVTYVKKNWMLYIFFLMPALLLDVYKRQLYYEFKDAGCDLTAGQKEVTGNYMDNFKRVWDMYTNRSAADKATLDSGSLNAE